MKPKLSKTEKRKALIAKAQGGEPTWDLNRDDSQLGNIMNWYSYNKSVEDAHKFFLAYLEFIDETELHKKAQNLGVGVVTSSIGWLARIVTLGGKPSPKMLLHLESAMEKIKNGVDEVVPEPKVTKTVSIQDRLEEKFIGYISHIDGKIDEFVLNGKTDFVPNSWFTNCELKAIQAKRIAENYVPLRDELKETIRGKDTQLVEAYSFMTKKELKAFHGFVSSIVDDATAWCETAKAISNATRKPRVRKEKSPLLQTAKIKYMKEHENLKSVAPDSIIGATQLWVYNTKYRSLGVYICPNDHGFRVKGTTILNFEESSSLSKRLRKPNDVIPKVLDGGKVQLRKLLDKVKAKQKPLTGRINSDTILLRVLR